MKLDKFVAFLALFLIALFAWGCSSGSIDPMTMQDPPVTPDRDSTVTGRYVMDTFRVEFDASTGTASIVPNREGAFHANVTGFAKPPNCFDCVQIIGSQYLPAQEQWTLNVQLKNPALITAYDVRGLVYNAGSKYLKNSDGFMNTYLSQDMNFKAFAKAAPNRAFTPGASWAESYVFHFPAGSSWTFVDYVIDASWPSNCKEPIIENVSFPEILANGITHATLTVTAFDHQPQDFFVVIADLTPLGSGPTALFDDGVHGDGTSGDGIFGATDIMAATAAGDYTVNIYAYDPGYNHGWNNFHVTVTGTANHPPSITKLTMNRTTVYKGSNTEKIQFNCTASDPDPGDSLSYHWECTGGSFDNSEIKNPVWKSPSAVGNYTATCEVTDGKGGFDDAQSDKMRVTGYAVVTTGAEPVANFTAERLVGTGSFQLYDYAPGNVILINFWATW